MESDLYEFQEDFESYDNYDIENTEDLDLEDFENEELPRRKKETFSIVDQQSKSETSAHISIGSDSEDFSNFDEETNENSRFLEFRNNIDLNLQRKGSRDFISNDRISSKSSMDIKSLNSSGGLVLVEPHNLESDQDSSYSFDENQNETLETPRENEEKEYEIRHKIHNLDSDFDSVDALNIELNSQERKQNSKQEDEDEFNYDHDFDSLDEELKEIEEELNQKLIYSEEESKEDNFSEIEDKTKANVNNEHDDTSLDNTIYSADEQEISFNDRKNLQKFQNLNVEFVEESLDNYNELNENEINSVNLISTNVEEYTVDDNLIFGTSLRSRDGKYDLDQNSENSSESDPFLEDSLPSGYKLNYNKEFAIRDKEETVSERSFITEEEEETIHIEKDIFNEISFHNELNDHEFQPTHNEKFDYQIDNIQEKNLDENFNEVIQTENLNDDINSQLELSHNTQVEEIDNISSTKSLFENEIEKHVPEDELEILKFNSINKDSNEIEIEESNQNNNIKSEIVNTLTENKLIDPNSDDNETQEKLDENVDEVFNEDKIVDPEVKSSQEYNFNESENEHNNLEESVVEEDTSKFVVNEEKLNLEDELSTKHNKDEEFYQDSNQESCNSDDSDISVQKNDNIEIPKKINHFEVQQSDNSEIQSTIITSKTEFIQEVTDQVPDLEIELSKSADNIENFNNTELQNEETINIISNEIVINESNISSNENIKTTENQAIRPLENNILTKVDILHESISKIRERASNLSLSLKLNLESPLTGKDQFSSPFNTPTKNPSGFQLFSVEPNPLTPVRKAQETYGQIPLLKPDSSALPNFDGEKWINKLNRSTTLDLLPEIDENTTYAYLSVNQSGELSKFIYSEARAFSNQFIQFISNILDDNGIVGVCSHPNKDVFSSIIACLNFGKTFAAIPISISSDNISNIISDANVQVIIIDESTEFSIQEALRLRNHSCKLIIGVGSFIPEIENIETTSFEEISKSNLTNEKYNISLSDSLPACILTNDDGNPFILSRLQFSTAIASATESIYDLSFNDSLFIGMVDILKPTHLTVALSVLSIGGNLSFSESFAETTEELVFYTSILKPSLVLIDKSFINIAINFGKEKEKEGGYLKKYMFLRAFEEKKAAQARGIETPFWDFVLVDKTKVLVGGNTRLIISSIPIDTESWDYLRVILDAQINTIYGTASTGGVGLAQLYNDFEHPNAYGIVSPGYEAKLTEAQTILIGGVGVSNSKLQQGFTNIETKTKWVELNLTATVDENSGIFLPIISNPTQ